MPSCESVEDPRRPITARAAGVEQFVVQARTTALYKAERQQRVDARRPTNMRSCHSTSRDGDDSKESCASTALRCRSRLSSILLRSPERGHQPLTAERRRANVREDCSLECASGLSLGLIAISQRERPDEGFVRPRSLDRNIALAKRPSERPPQPPVLTPSVRGEIRPVKSFNVHCHPPRARAD